MGEGWVMASTDEGSWVSDWSFLAGSGSATFECLHPNCRCLHLHRA